MSYQVKDYMNKEVITLNIEANVTEIAQVMTADVNNEGYVIILSGGKPVGIVTERDLIREVLAKEVAPTQIKISEIMSSPLITIDPDDDLLKASKLMVEQKVRKLVVMRNNIIYGILTAKDIAQSCGTYVEKSVKDVIRWTAPLSF